MKKAGDRRTRLTEVKRTDARIWHNYAASHTGDACRNILIGADDNSNTDAEHADDKKRMDPTYQIKCSILKSISYWLRTAFFTDNRHGGSLGNGW